MRLALTSDVHADHWKRSAPLRWKRAPLADVLLVAGDLHDDLQDGSADELRKAALVRHQQPGVRVAKGADLRCATPPALSASSVGGREP